MASRLRWRRRPPYSEFQTKHHVVDQLLCHAKRFSRTKDKISSKILLVIISIDYHDRRDLQRKPYPSLVRKSVDKAKVLHTYP